MATIIEELKALSAYPIPTQTLVSIAEGRGLLPHDVLTEDVRTAFRKATADVYIWLSNAPYIAQGGQMYNFTDGQRTAFRVRAQAILADVGEPAQKSTYGFKGTRL